MAKTLTVSEWKDRIRDGQRFQQRFAGSNNWWRYKNYYRHKFRAGTMPVNIVFSTLRSMVPQVYFKNPRVSITPRAVGLFAGRIPADMADIHARLLQTIDNWIIERMGIKEQLRKMAQDAFLAGIAGGFFGYDSLYGLDAKQFTQQQRFSMSQFDRVGDRIEFESRVSPGMPWYLRARPEDIIWPWGCESRDSAEWVALRFFRPLRDMKADSKYKGNVSDLTGTFTPMRTSPEGGTFQDPVDSQGLQKSEEWVEGFQIHDARKGKVYVVTHNHDKFLRNDDDELQMSGLPAETLVFNEDSDYIYGVPDARVIEPQLLELMDIRTQAMKHRRIDILKFLYKKNAIKREELIKLTNEDVQAGVEINADNALRDSVLPLNPGASGILSDLAAMGEIVKGDVRETVGFSRVAQGEFQGKSHVSAAETQRVFQSMGIRLDERRDAMADLLKRVIMDVNQVIFSQWTEERVAEIVGPDGAKWWLKFTGPQIRDEYDIHIEVEEGAPIDTETKKQRASDMAQGWAAMNAGAVRQGLPVPAEIQRAFFGQFTDLGIDIDRLLAQSAQGQSQLQAVAGGAGQTPGQAISPQSLAQIQQAVG